MRKTATGLMGILWGVMSLSGCYLAGDVWVDTDVTVPEPTTDGDPGMDTAGNTDPGADTTSWDSAPSDSVPWDTTSSEPAPSDTASSEPAPPDTVSSEPATGLGCIGNDVWWDSQSNLCWENPPADRVMNWHDADAYCIRLRHGGHRDWRLPVIEELIRLIRGCQHGIPTGDLSRSMCQVEPSMNPYGTWTTTCDPCPQFQGPQDDCYWDPNVTHWCSTYWSASVHPDLSTYRWTVFFGSAYVGASDIQTRIHVRCVRNSD